MSSQAVAVSMNGGVLFPLKDSSSKDTDIGIGIDVEIDIDKYRKVAGRSRTGSPGAHAERALVGIHDGVGPFFPGTVCLGAWAVRTFASRCSGSVMLVA